MAAELESMSFAELGKLFPIIISDYDPRWPALYLSEKILIEQAAGPHNVVRISHYGSTSVPGLSAKPTIDILLEIKEGIDNDSLVSSLKAMGYLFSPQPDNPPPHMMFMKGYTPEGFRGQAYHVHVRYSGDWRELHFCDYLRFHPDVAARYGILKKELKEKYEHDREAYTKAKTGFIERITEQALQGCQRSDEPSLSG